METIDKRPSENEVPVLTGEEAAPIPIEQAAAWTRNYRERYPNEIISHFFGINIINDIISQEGCIGLRVYYANSKSLNAFQKFIISICNFLRKSIANADGEKHLIIVGANKFGHDQLPGRERNRVGDKENDLQNENHPLSKSVMYSSEGGLQYIIAEQSSPCPGPGCPKNELSHSS